MTKTVLYARVSTSDQTVAHQRAQAEAKGYFFDAVVTDDGVSGKVPLKERPEGKRLFDMLRRGDTLVVRWVDRLGRDYNDVTDTIRYLMREGIIVRTIINDMEFDGSRTDAMGMAVRDAMMTFMAGMAQAQMEATKDAQRAGIDHAKTKEPEKFLGRKPTFDRHQLAEILRMAELGVSNSEIARRMGIVRQTVIRIRANPANAAKIVALWDRS
ncbi:MULTISPECIES: recombinase family protein [unclassified Rhizobium]|uniref:recombinase family protein n=1 Tax=unclassified Rhizobium TaxID=2613769 RepID=UPI001ADB882D|nr:MULTISPECIES: recombinase family protein [unclassified Rhizobium]MBO9122218.1 recombinase family protein [Rhizobium sp. 16-488-2b]MBO9172712.1 recombinase family protein [Rhizobium sp. 16-488-2a]